MKLFSLRGAQYFCQQFPGSGAFVDRSPDDFVLQLPSRLLEIGEHAHTVEFEQYRVYLLRDAVRDLFFGASKYRRSFDLMRPSSCHWAHVTLYYSAFLAARAMLSLFGCRVLSDRVVHVKRDAPGNQILHIQRIGIRSNQYHVIGRGSHQKFWHIFYNAVSSIRPFVDPQRAAALSPVSSDPCWMIKHRNRYNYESMHAHILARDFESNFSESDFPNSLPGPLNSQFQVCCGILKTCFEFAQQFDITMDSSHHLGAPIDLQQSVRNLVLNVNASDLYENAAHGGVFGVI